MSHFTTITTSIVSVDHLKKALHDMGFAEVEVHDTPQALYGFLTKSAAEVIMRRHSFGSLKGDIGFRRGKDGRFDAIITTDDRNTFDGRWLDRLTQRYAYHVTKDSLQQQGFDLVEETTHRNGAIQLTLRRMGN